jgi:hypothetical protein
VNARRFEVPSQNLHRNGDSRDNDELSTVLSYPHSDFMFKPILAGSKPALAQAGAGFVYPAGRVSRIARETANMEGIRCDSEDGGAIALLISPIPWVNPEYRNAQRLPPERQAVKILSCLQLEGIGGTGPSGRLQAIEIPLLAAPVAVVPVHRRAGVRYGAWTRPAVSDAGADR